MKEHDIVIGKDGSVRFVYADEVAALFEGEGTMATRRASHVEPACAYGIEGGGWLADMRPGGWPVIILDAGSVGFKTREEALAAERDWIRKETGL